jgi:hypothetical protein
MSEAHDLLARFRLPGAKPAAPPPQAATRYRAFYAASSSAKPLRLEIRLKSGMSAARLYSGISEIAYDRGDYTGILLTTPGKLIKVRGRHLKPVVESLIAGTAEFIAELKDGDRTPDGVPVITSIEMLTPQAATP